METQLLKIWFGRRYFYRVYRCPGSWVIPVAVGQRWCWCQQSVPNAKYLSWQTILYNLLFHHIKYALLTIYCKWCCSQLLVNKNSNNWNQNSLTPPIDSVIIYILLVYILKNKERHSIRKRTTITSPTSWGSIP